MVVIKKPQVLKLVLVIFLIGAISSANGAIFTVADFWEAGGKVSFTSKSTRDLDDNLGLDNEYNREGSYIYDGVTSNGNIAFNVTMVNTYVFDAWWLDLGSYIFLIYVMEKEDAVVYDFGVLFGSVDFLILEEGQYNLWRNLETQDQAQASEFISSNLETNPDVFNASTSGVYYFVWFNNPDENDDIIYVAFELQAELLRQAPLDPIEFNPMTLENEEGEMIDYLGMDTSDWKLGDTISIEINERPVDFSIIREEDLTIAVNNKTVKVPCWVLEKIGYNRSFLGVEEYSIEADYTQWKSKHSGTTLKITEDLDRFDENSELLGIYYYQYTVTSLDNVTIVPRATTFFLIPTVIGILVLIGYRRSKKTIQ